MFAFEIYGLLFQSVHFKFAFVSEIMFCLKSCTSMVIEVVDT
jgi:hypothetical protein